MTLPAVTEGALPGGRFRVGTAVVDLYPAPGTPMAGFAARTEPSTGVHDPLSVRALAVDGTCWITVDVCGLHERTCSEIAAALPLPPGHVAVTATHTHAGPCVMPGRLGGHDQRLLDHVVAAAVTAGRTALAHQSAATLTYREATGVGVARNRRHSGREIDPPVQLAAFHGTDRSVIAWVALYPCHPVVLGPANRLISGDYPAYTRAALEAAAPGSIALFLPGAAGDVNTGHRAEASYALADGPHRTIAEARRIGERVAQHALAAPPAEQPPGHAVATARHRAVRLRLEVRDELPAAELHAKWSAEAQEAEPGQAALLGSWMKWARQRVSIEELGWTARVSTFRWGPLTLVALPGEPFLETAETIAAGMDGPVMVTGYTNGCPGYLPPLSEYGFGGYEVTDAHRYYGMPAPFAPGSAEELSRVALDLASQHP